MSAEQPSLVKRAACEGLATALLVAAVIGSGIMGERLAGGNTAITLLANTIATGAALAALIITFGPISGAHFNPVVTLAGVLRRIFPWQEAIPYVAAQMIGVYAGEAFGHFVCLDVGSAESLREIRGLDKQGVSFVAQTAEHTI